MEQAQNNPKGYMDLDTHPLYLNEGRYRHAKNVRHVTDRGEGTLAIEPVYGTEFVQSLGNVTTQDAEHAIILEDFSGMPAKPFTFVLLPNGETKDKTQFVGKNTSSTDALGFEIANFLNGVSGITSIYSSSENKVSSTINVGTGYTIAIQELDGIIKETYLEKESITLSYTGQLTLINSITLGDKVFLFSTNNDKDDGRLGEVGVLKYNYENQNYDYTTLLRSTQLNFTTKYQIDLDGEIQNDTYNLYWCRKNDYLRTLKITKDQANGPKGFQQSLLYPNGGNYYVPKIGEQTKLVASGLSTAEMSFIGQDQNGGNIDSGGWRYSFRFLTPSLAPTDWSTLTNQIPVFTDGVRNTPDGDIGKKKTGKINKLRISGIDADLYDYIEILGINYIGGGGFSGYILARVTADDSVVEFSHTGFEGNVRNIGDLAELSVNSPSIDGAETLSIIGSRLTIGNVSYATNSLHDKMQKLASNIQITSPSVKLPSVGPNDDFSVEEFYKPENVYNYASYMPFETYRIGIRGIFPDGGVTPTYHCQDYQVGGGNITQYNPSTKKADIVLRKLVLDNIDISEVRDELAGIEVMRVEMDSGKQEVLGSGLADPQYDELSRDDATYNMSRFELVEESAADDFTNTVLTTNTFCAVSPDFLINPNFYSVTGDKVKILEADLYRRSGNKDGDGDDNNVFLEFNGHYFGSITEKDVDSAEYLAASRANLVDISPCLRLKLSNYTYNSPTYWSDRYNEGNYSIPLFFYIRPRPNKFERKKLSKYISTNSRRYIDDDTSDVIGNLDVWGGDSFTQKTVYKLNKDNSNRTLFVSFWSVNRMNSQLLTPYDDGSYNPWKYNSGYSIQNIVQRASAYNPDDEQEEQNQANNRIYFSEIKQRNSEVETYGQIPALNFKDANATFGPIRKLLNLNEELFHFQDEAFTREHFNSRGLVESDSGAVLVGSNDVLSKKEQRLSTYGITDKSQAIIGESVGGKDVVYWISPKYRKVLRWGYDGTKPVSEMKGVSNFLEENIINNELNVNPLQLGGISGVFDSRFKEAIFTINAYNPYSAPVFDGDKLVGQRNNSSSEYEGYVKDDPNSSDVTVDWKPYEVFFRTSDGDGKVYTPSQNIVIKASESNMKNLLNTTNSPTKRPSIWQEIEHGTKPFYNQNTLAYNEYKDGFTSFYDFYPRIYVKWGKDYMSEAPDNVRNGSLRRKSRLSKGKLFMHNRKGGLGNKIAGGEIYYQRGEKIESSVEIPINIHPNDAKRFLAARLNMLNKPSKVEFTTQDHFTVSNSGEIEEAEGLYETAILNDILNSNSPVYPIQYGGSESLRGKYVLVNVVFDPNNQNRDNLFGIIVKFARSPRTINT